MIIFRVGRSAILTLGNCRRLVCGVDDVGMGAGVGEKTGCGRLGADNPCELRRWVLGTGWCAVHGGGTGRAGGLVLCVSGVVGAIWSRNISERVDNAAIWALSSVAKGAVGDGLRSVYVKASATRIMLSDEEREGMGTSCGEIQLCRLFFQLGWIGYKRGNSGSALVHCQYTILRCLSLPSFTYLQGSRG